METNNEYEMNDRVLLLMETLRYKPVEFANAIKLIPSNISNLKQKKSKPGLQLIQNILQYFKNVNPYWLLLGEGEMLLNEEMDFDKMRKAFTLDNPVAKPVAGEIPMKIYDDLRSDYTGERARVDKLIDALTGNDKKSDKALIDYMGGVVADDGAGPPKRKAANW